MRTVKARLLRGNHYKTVGGKAQRVEIGTILDLTPNQVATLSDRVQLLSDTQAPAAPAVAPQITPEADEINVDEVVDAVLGGTVATISAAVADISESEVLDRLFDAETMDKNRAGVKRAITERQDALAAN